MRKHSVHSWQRSWCFGSFLRHTFLSWSRAGFSPKLTSPCPPPEKVHLVHLRPWFWPQDAQRQINPRRPCKGRGRGSALLCIMGNNQLWSSTRWAEPGGGPGGLAERHTPLSCGSSSPVEREEKVTFLKLCSSQALRPELLWVESQLDLGQTWLVVLLEEELSGCGDGQGAGTGGDGHK